MKFIAIIVLFNLANPTQPAVLLHKAYPTEAVCKATLKDMFTKLPKEQSVRVDGFCVRATDLLEMSDT